ncbi:MAG: alpha/beta fold hydrolase [Idiomarina sp.]
MSSNLLNYEKRGSGPTVVLIHGLFGDADNLNNLARSLEDDFTTLAIDVRNHGDSFHTDSMDYDSMAADVIAVIDHLKIKQVFLVGHSMGGKIAMQIAIDHPDRVHAAVFADIAPVAYDARHREILNALKNLDLSKVNSRGDADKQLAQSIETRGVRQFLLKNLRRKDGAYQWRLNLAVIDANYQTLTGAIGEGSYAGPVLFIKGGESDYILKEHRQAINEQFPNAEAKIMDGAGHWLHAEKPRIFNRLVKRFLDANTRS